jgi:hypothetical protein
MTMITDGQFAYETGVGNFSRCALILSDGAVPDFDALVTACKYQHQYSRSFVGSVLKTYIKTTLGRNVLLSTKFNCSMLLQKGGKLSFAFSTAAENPIALLNGTPTWGILALRAPNVPDFLESTANAFGLLGFTVGAKGSGSDLELSSASGLLTKGQIVKVRDLNITLSSLVK